MGGAAEHHFRKARPTTEELPWGTLVPSEYSLSAVQYLELDHLGLDLPSKLLPSRGVGQGFLDQQVQELGK